MDTTFDTRQFPGNRPATVADYPLADGYAELDDALCDVEATPAMRRLALEIADQAGLEWALETVRAWRGLNLGAADERFCNPEDGR